MSNKDLEKDSDDIKEISLEAYKDERTEICNPVFKDGYSAGWHFVFPEAFKDALDIKITPRVIGGREYSIYTQGKYFCFKTGDLMYDTLQAYKMVWGDALKHIKYAVQVESSSPTITLPYKKIESIGPIKYLENGKEKKDEKLLKIQRIKYVFGTINFSLLKTNLIENKLTHYQSIETTQDQFVLFLQTGKLRNNDNTIFSIL